jgi:predicted DNA-binding transcriptional regulator AlpA
MAEILVDGKEAARRLGCTVSALALWRRQRRGPTYVRLGRLVRYREADLDTWVQSCRIHSGDGQAA